MDSILNNPTNLMSLVKNVSESLDKKMKQGEINQEELLKESSSVINNMGGDFQKLFANLGMGDILKKSNIDTNRAKQNYAKMSTRERLRKKLEAKKNNK